MNLKELIKEIEGSIESTEILLEGDTNDVVFIWNKGYLAAMKEILDLISPEINNKELLVKTGMYTENGELKEEFK